MMPEALGAAAGAGAGASSSLLDLLAPLDYPRQSLWNAVYAPFAAAGNGDYSQLLRALPGAVGGGIGALAGGLPGAVLGGGLAQGLARLSGSSLFDAPTGGDVVRGLGGDSDSIPGMIGGMGLQMAGDPLTFLGASMGARAAGPNKLPGGPIMGPKLPGGAPEMPASIPTQFDAIPPGPRQWPTMGYDAQLNPIPATSFGAHTYGPPTMSDAAFLRAQAGKEGAESLMGSTQFAPPPPSVQPSMAQLDEMVNSLKGDPMARFDPNDFGSMFSGADDVATGLPGVSQVGDEMVLSDPSAIRALLAQGGSAPMMGPRAALSPQAAQASRELDDYLKILADAYEEGSPELNRLRMDAIRRFYPGNPEQSWEISNTFRPLMIEGGPPDPHLNQIESFLYGMDGSDRFVRPGRGMSDRAQYALNLLSGDMDQMGVRFANQQEGVPLMLTRDAINAMDAPYSGGNYSSRLAREVTRGVPPIDMESISALLRQLGAIQG